MDSQPNTLYLEKKTEIILPWIFFVFTRNDQKVCGSSYFEYRGMKIWPLLFKIISLQGNSLSSSLFKLSYQNRRPFPTPPSTRLLPIWRLHCFHTAYHVDGKSVLGTNESQKETYQENMGMRKDFKYKFSRISHGYLWHVCRGVVLQEQNTASQFSSPLSWDILALPSQFACIICIVYRATLFKIINHDNPLTIQKMRPSPSLLNESS